MTSRVTTRAIVLLYPLCFAHIAQAQQPAPAAAAAPAQQTLGKEQLDALVAPIALYPDPLLSEVLMASTYPLEVVEANRWADANKNLQGDQLKAAVDKQDWDNSLKALVATPSVLAMMSEKLDWTQKLGNAVLAQQAGVMDAIQRLRAKAQAANKLQTTPQQTVSVQQDAGQQVIAIEPASADTIYVPYYNPSVVYGDWPYPDYPPYYFPPPGYIAGAAIATGIAFGAGYALGRWASGGYIWGGGFRWRNGNIVVNRPVNINAKTANWQHNAYHRRGVAYGNADIARRFGGNTAGDRNRANLNFRGSNGAQVVKPNAGNKPISRANAISGGNRANAKLSAGARAKGTNRGATNVHARTPAGSHGARVAGNGRPGGGRSLAVAGGGGRAHGGGGGRGGGRRR
jgi:Protein of unknown function (DUF3300)